MGERFRCELFAFLSENTKTSAQSTLNVKLGLLLHLPIKEDLKKISSLEYNKLSNVSLCQKHISKYPTFHYYIICQFDKT